MSVPLQALTKRIENWQEKLADKTAVIFSLPADITYFTNFGFLLPTEREAFLVISATKATLWYTSFSPLPTTLATFVEPMFGLQTVINSLRLEAEFGNIDEIWFDMTNLTVAEHSVLQQIPDVNLKPLDKNLIWQLRTQKDLFEQAALAKVGLITTKVLMDVRKKIKIGQTENEVAWLLEKSLREAGAEGLAFPTIVAFGDNTALPHHQPTERKLTDESAVLIDVGGKYRGYCADMTRSFWFGQKPPASYLKIQQVVHGAYDAALAWLNQELAQNRPILAKSIDVKTRQIITDAGFGKEFIHTTGHGVGIEIHEPPSLSWRNEANLPANVCLTVEPGIYLINQYGYRHENTIQVIDQKIDVLTELKV